MNLHKFFIAGFFLVSSHVAFAESCQEKVNSDGAYRYSHSIPIGNGMYECYVIAKDGSGQPIKDSVAFDEQTPAAESVATPKAEDQKDKKADKEETCEEKYKDMQECFEYEGNGMTSKNYSEAYKILVKINSGVKIHTKDKEVGSPSTECVSEGRHWNFHAKKDYKGSILCCECCINEKNGPNPNNVRCKASPN